MLLEGLKDEQVPLVQGSQSSEDTTTQGLRAKNRDNRYGNARPSMLRREVISFKDGTESMYTTYAQVHIKGRGGQSRGAGKDDKGNNRKA